MNYLRQYPLNEIIVVSGTVMNVLFIFLLGHIWKFLVSSSLDYIETVVFRVLSFNLWFPNLFPFTQNVNI